MAISTQIIRRMWGAFLGYSHSMERDLYDVFGYPRALTVEEFYEMYRRNDIAARIIRSFPQATWRQPPEVTDEGKPVENNPLRLSRFGLAFHKFAKETNLWQFCERADRLSGIGRYSVLVLGFSGEKDFTKPLGKGKKEFLYFAPYGEVGCDIVRWGNDPTRPRYGLPEIYRVQRTAPRTGGGQMTRSIEVHHSRLIHIAEGLEEDDVYGTPRLEAVYNRIKDLEKVVGGSAEGFWLNARAGMALETDKEAELTEDEIKNLREQAEEWQHQLRRIMAMRGVNVRMLNASIADPKPNVDTLMELVAGTVGIPKRILVGSERGELSSEQDENNWAARIDERRHNFATPTVLRPLITKLIDAGTLPKPVGEWDVDWPDPELSEKERSEIAKNKAEATSAYSSTPEAQLIVPKQEFRRWLGEPEESEHEVDLSELPLLPEDDPDADDPPTDDPNEEEEELAEPRDVMPKSLFGGSRR